MLRNGQRVHKNCLFINEERTIKSLESQANGIRADIRNLRPNYSFWGSIFGDADEDRRVQNRRRELTARAKKLDEEISELSKIVQVKQANLNPKIWGIVAQWPGYPPDDYWNSLRHQLANKANFRCKKCRVYVAIDKGHAHHNVPLRFGGLNELSNLSWLCRSCHEAKHSHNLMIQQNETLNTPNPKKPHKPTTTLQKIDYCQSSGSRLRIQYQKPNGEVSIRTLKVIRHFREKPPGRRKWLIAYCFKRRAERTFNIGRIKTADIVEK